MKQLGKPEANSDVINKQPKTLLIGYGWVGQHVGKYFTQAFWTDETKEVHRVSDNELVESPVDVFPSSDNFEVAFLQVPTPMNKDGSCDLSFIEDAVANWYSRVALFIIRSTVPPGTTERLNSLYNQYGCRFVFQPEYIGETVGHPNLDPKRDPFIILGGHPEDTAKAAKYWSTVLNANATYHQLSAMEAEIVKYMENSFLATKVLFVNDFARLCRSVGADFYKVREAWLADPRIGRSHSMAHEDNPGFSGKCLPKDLNAITHWAKEQAQPLELIEQVLKVNAKMRENFESSVPLLPEEPTN